VQVHVEEERIRPRSLCLLDVQHFVSEHRGRVGVTSPPVLDAELQVPSEVGGRAKSEAAEVRASECAASIGPPGPIALLTPALLSSSGPSGPTLRE